MANGVSKTNPTMARILKGGEVKCRVLAELRKKRPKKALFLVRKEAWIKYLGTGMYTPLVSLSALTRKFPWQFK